MSFLLVLLILGLLFGGILGFCCFNAKSLSSCLLGFGFGIWCGVCGFVVFVLVN